MIDGGLRAVMGFVRSVAQSNHPFARMAQVVAHLLERLGGNRRKLLVGRFLQRIPYQHHQRAVEKIAHQRRAVVHVGLRIAHERAVVRQLKQRVVAEVARIAEIRERVFGRPVAERGRRVLIQQARLTDEIEAHVGKRNVFFERRTVARPLGIALAQHQRVVREMQQIGSVCRGRGGGRHHMCPTSSGMS